MNQKKINAKQIKTILNRLPIKLRKIKAGKKIKIQIKKKKQDIISPYQKNN